MMFVFFQLQRPKCQTWSEEKYQKNTKLQNWDPKSKTFGTGERDSCNNLAVMQSLPNSKAVSFGFGQPCEPRK